MQLSYTDVKEINVVEDPVEVNRLLKKGWVLLTIERYSEEAYSRPLYILGWVHDVSVEIYAKQLEYKRELQYHGL